jgi:hypothetical protein
MIDCALLWFIQGNHIVKMVDGGDGVTEITESRP